MRISVAVALLAVGISLLIDGLNASSSLASAAARPVPGIPNERCILLIVSGIAGILFSGMGLFLRGS